jgi:hypothetical protein
VLRTLLCSALLLVVAGASATAAEPTGALVPLRQGVLDRLGDLPSDAPRSVRKALERSRDDLAPEPADLQSEIAVAARSAKWLRKALPTDFELTAVLDEMVATVAGRVYIERDFLASEADSLSSPRDVAHAEKAVATATRTLSKLAGKVVDARARILLKACRVLEKSMARFGLVLPDPDDPVEPGEVVADWTLNDLNTNSATSGQGVSPRQYQGRISAWYFAHAT